MMPKGTLQIAYENAVFDKLELQEQVKQLQKQNKRLRERVKELKGGK